MQLASEYVFHFASDARKLKGQTDHPVFETVQVQSICFSSSYFLASKLLTNFSFTCTPSIISIFHIKNISESYLYSFATPVGVIGFCISRLPLGFFPHFNRAPLSFLRQRQMRRFVFFLRSYLKLPLFYPQP